MRSVEKSRGNKVYLPYQEIIEHSLFKKALSMILTTLETADLKTYVKVPANIEPANQSIKKLKDIYKLESAAFDSDEFLDLLDHSAQIKFKDESLAPKELLNYLIYLVLFTLIKKNYNSVVRQAIKLMLTALQPSITKIY